MELKVRKRYSFTTTASIQGNPINFAGATVMGVLSATMAMSEIDIVAMKAQLTVPANAAELALVDVKEATYYKLEMSGETFIIPDYIIVESSVTLDSAIVYAMKLTIQNQTELVAIQTYLQKMGIPYEIGG